MKNYSPFFLACRVILFAFLGYIAAVVTNSPWTAAAIIVVGLGIGLVSYIEGRLDGIRSIVGS